MTHRLGAAVFLAAMLSAAPSGATTTLGRLDQTTDDPGMSTMVVSEDPTGGPSYVVPPGHWLVREFAVKAAATGADPGLATVLVWRATATADTFRVVTRSDFAVPGGSEAAIYRTVLTTPAAVEGGDALGLAWGYETQVYRGNAPGAWITYASSVLAPGVGGDLKMTDTFDHDYAVEAVVEADADGDGKGDETDDACPADAAASTAPCATDLGVTATMDPASVVAGGTAVLTVSAANAGAQRATAAVATVDLPAGVTATPLDPCGATDTGFYCPLGDVPAGATRTARLRLTGVTEGAKSIVAGVHHSGVDPVAANDSAAAALTVTASSVVTPPVVTPPVVTPPAKTCTVPKKLKGRTATAARKALKKAGCTNVLVRRPKGKLRKGYVLRVAQVTPGGTIAAGNKVTVRLKAVRKKR